MGCWFAKLFRDEGYSVVVTSRNQEKLSRIGSEFNIETNSFLEAIKGADRILVCVPVDALNEVVKIIRPGIQKNQILMDICSVKKYPVDILHKNFPNNLILGTHPVFGPGSTSLKNKTFVLTPTNAMEKKFALKFKTWLETKQVRVFILSPEKHDKLMSVVLGLSHFIGLVACDILLEQKDYPETKNVAGTTFKMLFTLAEVATLEEPELFNSLQSHLSGTLNLETQFIHKANEWLKLIKKKDSKEITAKMKQLKSKLKTVSDDVEHSYKVMYKMLESLES